MFTEQEIAMLSGVLRSDVTVQVLTRMMNTFVEMRRFVTNDVLLFEKISDIELKQLEYQKNTDEKFDKVFRYIKDHTGPKQKTFFDDQIYDVLSLIASIIQKTQEEIVLTDGYMDVDTLSTLMKKSAGVDVKIYTYANVQPTEKGEARFNVQYPTPAVRKIQVFHNRLIFSDGGTAYRVGASIKDVGRKCSTISLADDPGVVTNLLNWLKTI